MGGGLSSTWHTDCPGLASRHHTHVRVAMGTFVSQDGWILERRGEKEGPKPNGTTWVSGGHKLLGVLWEEICGSGWPARLCRWPQHLPALGDSFPPLLFCLLWPHHASGTWDHFPHLPRAQALRSNLGLNPGTLRKLLYLSGSQVPYLQTGGTLW